MSNVDFLEALVAHENFSNCLGPKKIMNATSFVAVSIYI